MFVKAIKLTRGKKCMVILLPDVPAVLMSPANSARIAGIDPRKALNKLMDQQKVSIKYRDMSTARGQDIRIIAFNAYMAGVDLGVKIERIVLTEKSMNSAALLERSENSLQKKRADLQLALR